MTDANDAADTFQDRRRAFLARTAVAAPAVAVMLKAGARPAFAQPYSVSTDPVPTFTFATNPTLPETTVTTTTPPTAAPTTSRRIATGATTTTGT